MLKALSEIFMSVELSRTTYSFQIELRLAFNFVLLNYSHLILDFVQNLKFFNIFPNNYSIWIEGQLEHSGLRPDIRAVLFCFSNALTDF